MHDSPAPRRLDVAVDLGLPLADLAKVLTGACEQVEDTAARLVVASVTGCGDRPGAPGTTGVHEVNGWERALRRWERLDALTVAVAVGNCAGPALDLLSACDLRVAGPALSLALPGTPSTGFWPGTVLHRLTQRNGGRATRHLCLLADRSRPLTAARALELGLVDEIHGPAELDAHLAELAARLPARMEPALLRQLVADAEHTSFEEALGVHLAACDRVLKVGAAHPDDV
ncbi:enoyl-CoA-hydratase DpgB [Streptomyces sp. NPDC087294]|uniref:enoyl-CoA-hydratase DpgB n=1 Tax=Streptomyces sp. NPDC087294 TaxID=3365777 RepID=UPI00381888FC